MDPEEALGGDELEGVVERHDLTAEGSRVAPSLPSPPQHLHLVALTGRAQPGDGRAGAPAVERVAPVRAHRLDAATPGRPGVSLNACAHLIGAAGHGRLLPALLAEFRRSGSRAEAVRHDAERGSRGAGWLDAALAMPLHRGRLEIGRAHV